ncbi:MAG: EAL domain-containing protein [Anaerolineae bacterium]|nr:EAL domain-containing protein [Anaerolineae bacterium]MBT3712156.1 EAL domain-containing protein [Anaerolineae bacterium]MBT4312224.1 EAL domain-containing protein [Anaerolineae bacterium]MBT4457541.1 EAL domain-containing protein [Anaerolineae bacterium]MBT4843594.1 EAL domain-containing protein [Anaerolineae bacterium]
MIENINKETWLLIIRSTDDGLHKHILEPGQNNLGRNLDNDIILHDKAASGYHAEINYDEANGTVTIRDNESTNGLFVNGKLIYQTQTLHHEDQIRVGLCLITIVHSESKTRYNRNTQNIRTRVTSELIVESLDHYGVLLYDIGQRLVNMPDLNTALAEITELIKRMIGAEECQVITADQFDKLNEKEIPISFAQKIIENKTATIFSNTLRESRDSDDQKTVPVSTMVPMLLVPVMIDENVVALIFARKSVEFSTLFYNSDLHLVLAVSNQVAMSILRNRVESELIHRSYHDSLTGLPNRDLFLNRLSQSITRSKKEKDFDFAVLFFDIDNFKIVNDSLGHSTGDKLLVAIAERLNHNVRDIDTVIARFGGDEFAILLDDVKESLFAVATANRLREILSRPYNINEKQIFSGVSIGVATSTIGYDHPEDILQDADIAMYQAKELRKARVEIYNKSMRDRALERMHMVTALKQGALQKEFRLHYQPVISLQTGRVAGFEALLRWYTPNRGILNPADFIDMIDTAGLIYSTDHWALQNACRQATEWQNKFPSNPPLFIAANLSARNIKHPNLVDNINQVLQETKLEPDRLWLEITEKVSAPDDEGAIEVLKKLRSTGVRISIDDFDTGYSALNYLARFPVDVLKIDKSFVQMIGQEDDSQKIIEMIKALANHLGLTVIAEGVETAEQIPFLQSINCEYAQGFFYAKPLDAQAATELLANRHSW